MQTITLIQSLTCKGLSLLLLTQLSLLAMTSEEWQAYKQSNAYKKERAKIEARKARSASFQNAQKQMPDSTFVTHQEAPTVSAETINSTAFNNAKALQKSLTISEVVALREMLKSKRFEALNETLQTHEMLFEHDSISDYQVSDAYYAFRLRDTAYERLLRQWILATPDAYQPYMAIGMFYFEKAWESRGTRWAKDTSEAQFSGMRKNFEKAENYLQRALKIKPDLMVAYQQLILLYSTSSRHQQEQSMIENALKRFPYSYQLRATIMGTLQPKWGGSYAAMRQFAEASQQYASKNPRMVFLLGEESYERAFMYEREKRYTQALDTIEQALQYADCWDYYYLRAEIYYQNGAYDKALEAIERAIQLRPIASGNYKYRANIQNARKNYSAAKEDLKTAMRLNPDRLDSKTVETTASSSLMKEGHRAFRAKDLKKAIEYYTQAIQEDSQNYTALYWKGEAHRQLRESSKALEDFEKAIKINPDYFKAYLGIDHVLAPQGQWKKLLRFWDNYIKRNPRDAKAYFERSGTHYHAKQMKEALSDMKHACELGHHDACKQYKRLI